MNKKITVIQLLNKIANREDLPKSIKYYGFIWQLHNGNYFENGQRMLEDYLANGIVESLNDEVEILEDNTEEIEELNAYKLMESPYMANLLKEQRYDKFMELLKQSEVEIADKLIKLTWVVKEMRKEIKCIELD